MDEPLVGRRAAEVDLAVGHDLGRFDRRVQHVHELIVEAVDDRAGEHAVEREAADQQQRRDPYRGDADHAPGQRAGAPPMLQRSGLWTLVRRRGGSRGGQLVQIRRSSGSSRL